MIDRRAFLKSGGALAVVGTTGAVWKASQFLGAKRQDEGERVTFGDREPLVELLQTTPADQVIATLARLTAQGVAPDTLVGASILANVRTFAGEDYTGYHGLMALRPALAMAPYLDERDGLAAVYKVIHRNVERIAAFGGRDRERLRRADRRVRVTGKADDLLAAERSGDDARAIAEIAAAARRDPRQAFRLLQPVVRENVDVHQVVLAWRSYDLLDLAGRDNAEALLVQGLRQCLQREADRRKRGNDPQSIRRTLPALLVASGLDSGLPESGAPWSDDAVDALAQVVFDKSSEEAMSAVAAALAAGTPPDDVAAAIELAALRLILRDPGRSRAEPGKQIGSIHGASIGVHAADSADAWVHGAAALPEDRAALLCAAAWHTGDQGRRCLPAALHLKQESVDRHTDATKLALELKEAACAGEQAAASAMALRHTELAGDADATARVLAPLFLECDGALHHEKVFTTLIGLAKRIRPRFRPLVGAALGRIAASGAPHRAAIVNEARRALS